MDRNLRNFKKTISLWLKFGEDAAFTDTEKYSGQVSVAEH